MNETSLIVFRNDIMWKLWKNGWRSHEHENSDWTVKVDGVYGAFLCPTCGGSILYGDYCDECGQKLKWGDYQ